MVSYAVQHTAAHTIDVTVSRTVENRLRVEMAEENHTVPARDKPESTSAPFDGPLLISALSDRYGHDSAAISESVWTEKVWCEFDMDRAREFEGTRGAMPTATGKTICALPRERFVNSTISTIPGP